VKKIFDLIGRILISFIFFYEAIDSFVYFNRTAQKMEYYGLTWNKDYLLYGAIILLILGGLSVLTGYRAKLGAFLLLMYWIPVTFMVHDFWNVPRDCIFHFDCTDIGLTGEDLYRRLQGFLFMKNLAIIGGLLILLVNGSGEISIKRIFATTRVPGA
jgi:putative oxidoreductase